MFLWGVNALCSEDQQPLLDSHRVGTTNIIARNLAEDLMQGSDTALIEIPAANVDSKVVSPDIYYPKNLHGEISGILTTFLISFKLILVVLHKNVVFVKSILQRLRACLCEVMLFLIIP